MEKVCRTKKREMKKANTTGAVIAAAQQGVASQPLVNIKISADKAGDIETLAVADTGAMVCVAGPGLMQELGLSKAKLTAPSALKDVAGRSLNVLGAKLCKLSVGQESTYQTIHFIESANRYFISLETCKQLKLVHEGFPKQLQPSQVGHVRATEATSFDTPSKNVSATSKPQNCS